MRMIDADDRIPHYRELAARVHRYGTPIFLQITHCGRQTFSRATGLPTVAPSPLKDKLYNEDVPLELNDAEIEAIIQNFVRAIGRAKEAGCDGIQLQLCHGHLLSAFLSPHMNQRQDRWGGSTANRFRIVREILARTRERVGSYPILAKINGYERSKDGIKLAEAVRIARLLEEAGCDAIEVSCGTAEEGLLGTRGEFPFAIMAQHNHLLKRVPKLLYPVAKAVLKRSFGSPEPRHLYNLDGAAEIKRNLKIPVIVVGGIRRRADIQNIIQSRQCDFVAMCRPFIIEPALVAKFRENRQEQSRCIDCNYCLIGVEQKSLRCYYGKV
jgi:2,4-dienoyl-CoA reductase-like NADH-dependent reductase (Old Yellow Enzyme family)